MRVIGNYFRNGRQGLKRAPRVLVVCSIALTAAVAVAVADEVSNNIDATVDSTLENMALTAGGSTGSTTLTVHPANGDGVNGCNVKNDGTLVLNVVSSDTDVATVSPSTVTFTDCQDSHPTVTVTPVAQGSATISFTINSNNTGGTFDLAPASFRVNVGAGTVTKQNQTISFPSPGTRTYGDAAFAPGATSTSGLTVTYTTDTPLVCGINASQQVTILAAGTCTITGSQAGNSSYNAATPVQQSYTINPLGITGNITVSNKEYDGGTAATISGTSLNGVINSDDVSLVAPNPSTATFASSGVGTGIVVSPGALSGYSLSGTKAGNYTLTSVGNTTADITRRAITVTADNKSKVIGGTDPALTYTVTTGSLVTGESLTGALTRVAGETPGTYAINQGTLTNANNANYNITFVAGTFRITFSTTCGLQIGQPINTDGTSVFKQKSTVPAKFTVCDADGDPVYVPGTVVSVDRIYNGGTAINTINEELISTNATAGFRWSETDQQWIWNIATKGLSTGTYAYTANLLGGQVVNFSFGLR